MKYLGLILLVALVACQALAFRINENDNALQDPTLRVSNSEKFRNFLEKLKDMLREGDEKLGIPQMDPFYTELLERDIKLDIIEGSVALIEAQVTGLSGYYVDKADVSVFKRTLTIGLTWPHIYSEGFYKMDLVVDGENKIFGEGHYELTLNDLSFESVASVGIFGGVSVKDLQTSISLGAMKLNATGIFNDDDASAILSEAISDMAPRLLEDYQKEVTDYVNNMAKTIINKQLEGKSLKEILDMIS